MKNVVSILCAGVMGLGVASLSYGATLTLTQVAPHTVGPQSASNPCVIAATQCKQPAGFDFTNFSQKGSVPDYDEFSPEYTVSQFPDLAFVVAIDVNTTKEQGEILDFFEVLVNGVQQWVYDGDGNIGSFSSNGNGFADWTLGDIDLSAFGPDDVVQFHAIWNTASDGGESFFLVGGESEVPVPGTLGLFGIGLTALGLVRRKQAA